MGVSGEPVSAFAELAFVESEEESARLRRVGRSGSPAGVRELADEFVELVEEVSFEVELS